MRPDDRLATATILTAFTEEVAAQGGRVTDTFDDGTRLFTRSVLPLVEQVRPGDGVQGGVALRAAGEEVRLHPYVFRLVCRNGAIQAHATQTRTITDLSVRDPDEVLVAVREGVRECCDPEAFSASAERMRSAAEVEADMGLALLPHLSRLPPELMAHVLDQIMRRFTAGGDGSRFGLMNAVTSLARDTRDPDLRWRLEELGGAIPALAQPPRRPATGSARRAAMAAGG
jgi:hypothetical protein